MNVDVSAKVSENIMCAKKIIFATLVHVIGKHVIVLVNVLV